MNDSIKNVISDELINECQELIILFNERGEVEHANRSAEAALGEDLIGRCITQVFPLIVFKKSESVYWNHAEKYVHTFAYKKNQTCFPVKLNILWTYLSGERWGVCFAIDDSERSDAIRNHQKAMDEVAQADKMKNEFTANITHELRTPINGIKGMAEGLLDTELSQEQEDTIGVILKCCENMTKIINDILDFAKMEAGKLSVEYREFNFKKFLDDNLFMNATRINEKGLKLVVDVGENVPTYIVGDELRLGQVLNNLFSNATKFTQNGHIGLEIANTFEDDKEVELFFVVMDTGIGIAPEERDKLFKSFSQVDGSITRRFGGTGLGLAICKQLVELMGGSIRVDSEKGKGSTFSFSVRFGKSKESADQKNYPEGHFVYDKKKKPEQLEEQALDFTASKGFNLSFSDADAEEDIEEDETRRAVNEAMEKLIIGIELSAWEKAEKFATTIKTELAESEKDLKTLAFQLLLCVRKEEHDKALELIRQLDEKLVGEE